MTDENLIKAATNALAMIDAFYEWHDRVEKAGGTTCITGIAAAHAMHTSMKKQRPRVESLITKPLKEAISKANNVFDEYGNYGENNPPLPPMSK